MVAAWGDQLVLAGTDGVALLEQGGDEVRTFESPVTHLSAGPGGLAIPDDLGKVWVGQGTDWTLLNAPADDLISAVSAIDATYAGTRSGQLWRYADGWQECASLPQNQGEPDVVLLAATDEHLIAVPGGFAPVVSEDGCASWELIKGMHVSYGGSGGAETAADAYTAIPASGDRWVITGWDGVGVTYDAGQTWIHPTVIPADYVRGLAMSPQFGSDHTAWIGGNLG